MFRRRWTRRKGGELDLGDPASVPCRRASPRLADPGVRGLLHRRRRAHLVDVGGGGFRVETRRPLQRCADYRVRFAEPGSSLGFAAEPVWSQLVRTETDRGRNVHPVYAAGFRFTHSLDSEHRRALGDFVKDRAERPVANRRPPRYLLRRGTDAELTATVPFSVRELSLSGLLLESAGLEEVKGDAVALTLHLPASPIDLAAKVVNARRLPGTARAGVAFEALDDRQWRALDGFVSGRLSEGT
ncbi:MAG: PilZ domain-containing protein [Acidobacteriota bacterium]